MIERRIPVRGIGRRVVLVGLAGVLGASLASCAVETAAPAATSRPKLKPQPRGPADPDPELGLAPEPESEPAPAVVDVEAVIAAHEGMPPTAWGMEFAGIVRTGADAGSAQPASVFLTFDACGGPAGSGFDGALIDGLVTAGIPATLFLNKTWIETNLGLAQALAAEPLFSLQNHGSRHLPLSVTGAAAYGIPGTVSAREAAMEVWENHVLLTELTGRAPSWFRPGTAHLDDVGRSISEALGERIAGFTINGDQGATLHSSGVTEILLGSGGGEIVLAHMNRPGSGTAQGVLDAIPQLLDRGISFSTL